jgi:hypothetical protein
VDRNKAVLPELGSAYLENAFDQIHVSSIEAQRFARAQAGTGQQAYQRLQGLPSLLAVWRNMPRFRHERCQFHVIEDSRW